jgi:hypothetical protein
LTLLMRNMKRKNLKDQKQTNAKKVFSVMKTMTIFSTVKKAVAETAKKKGSGAPENKFLRGVKNEHKK